MIRYALACEHDHEFDGWFPSSDGFDAQVEAGEVLCPHCGSASVRKALMAPSIGKSIGKSAPQGEASSTPAAMAQKMSMMMLALRKHVEENCDYVGDAFAEEARRIHYGETEHRDIYGEATPDEARELIEEGVEVAPLPIVPRRSAN
ncbi:DUF1178 family protein [Parvibaculum sp.]|jgi:hypothetical protein|uniref:DUF1178 family protein n=1 Tax=Parvibaculum sp. TaxID=2024848 RepID=UPI001B246DE4|nr:DUF1178 family protein [Parvibaculum sp.]MBO6633831.1 DUF1178 family protein [Parvibaculum sp.]MBO6676964.1 DUF1178 family protein [Parvibaculum sp.]MBO6685867.1 DUF1178 family protein [Parvibaculum sp.]MBO6904097.1 DUF1178 family protein [Parvibaculum sp.]